MNKLFFLQVAEQTIYFPIFAEQSFFFTKNHRPPPPQESNGWTLNSMIDLIYLNDILYFVLIKNSTLINTVRNMNVSVNKHLVQNIFACAIMTHLIPRLRIYLIRNPPLDIFGLLIPYLLKHVCLLLYSHTQYHIKDINKQHKKWILFMQNLT